MYPPLTISMVSCVLHRRSHGGTISTLASLGHLVASSGVTDSALAFLLVTDIFLTLCIGLYLLLLQPESTR